MSNIQLKPVPQSQFDETKSAEDLFLSGYTDKDGARKNVRIRASSFVGSAHAKAYQGDILGTKVFRLSSSEEMYMGTITNDVLLSETNASSCYGTLYLFVKNDTDKEHSITLPEGSYHFFPQSQNKIGIPAGSYIELAIKAYGVDRVVTNISSLEERSGMEYRAGDNITIDENIISATDTVYDDTELRELIKDNNIEIIPLTRSFYVDPDYEGDIKNGSIAYPFTNLEFITNLDVTPEEYTIHLLGVKYNNINLDTGASYSLNVKSGINIRFIGKIGNEGYYGTILSIPITINGSIAKFENISFYNADVTITDGYRIEFSNCLSDKSYISGSTKLLLLRGKSVELRSLFIEGLRSPTVICIDYISYSSVFFDSSITQSISLYNSYIGNIAGSIDYSKIHIYNSIIQNFTKEEYLQSNLDLITKTTFEIDAKLNALLEQGGTIGGNLKVVGDINAKRFLKDE